MGDSGMESRSVEHRSGAGDRALREAHVLAAPLQHFDVQDETERLRRERPYQEHDRNAKTLVKSEAFRVVLVALRRGARFDEDDPRGHVSMLVREGSVSLAVGDERAKVGPGQIAAISAGHRWSAVADEETVVMLHFSWPG